MEQQIKIKKKGAPKGDDGHRVVSVRMPEDLLEQLEDLSARTNRSRNELINILLREALPIVKVEE